MKDEDQLSPRGFRRRGRNRTSARSVVKARFRAHPRYVMVSVHRGLWDPLPENSISAIRGALNCDVVEVDVQLDAEGTPYLMHDETWDRMTGLSVTTAGADPYLRRTARLREGAGGADAAMTVEVIPTLEDAFLAIDRTGAIFDLDVKWDEDIEAVAEVVEGLGCQDLCTLKVDIRRIDDIAGLVELERRYDIMVMAKLKLRSKADLALVVALREADVAAAEVWFDDLNLLRSATAFASDLVRFGTYTLDPVHCLRLSDRNALSQPGAVWGQLVNGGVGLIMTDQPEALSKYLMTR